MYPNSVGKKLKLSICISTFNRANYIGETLESILSQLSSEVEIVIVDGASNDNTSEIVAKYILQSPQIRYIREETNSGVDADYDKAVGYASGQYCWLMSDDDIFKTGAIKRILGELDEPRDLVLVNYQFKNADLSKDIVDRNLALLKDKNYTSKDSEIFFIECANFLTYIGSVVVRRKFWMERDRQSFYGTLFVHVGVIFQQPSIRNIFVISDPQIILRYGNAMWQPRGFEIWAINWPKLVWSFANYSDEAKRKICHPNPWNNFKMQLYHRAIGSYSKDAFIKFIYPRSSGIKRSIFHAIALCPGSLINIILIFYFLLFKRGSGQGRYDLLRSSHATKLSHLLANLLWK
jgi:abequosyltransferase